MSTYRVSFYPRILCFGCSFARPVMIFQLLPALDVGKRSAYVRTYTQIYRSIVISFCASVLCLGKLGDGLSLGLDERLGQVKGS